MQYLVLIYKGKSNHDLYTSETDSKYNWIGNTPIQKQGNEKIDPTSDDGPGAAMFNKMLFLIYKGVGSTELYFCHRQKGGWYGNELLMKPGSDIVSNSNHSPNLCEFNDRLYTVYVDSKQKDMKFRYYENNAWTDPFDISYHSDNLFSHWNPAMVVFQDNLFVLFPNAANELHMMILNKDNKCICVRKIMTEKNVLKSDTSPTAVVYRGKLTIYYKGENSKDLYYSEFIPSSSYDKDFWTQETKIEDQDKGVIASTYAPKASVFNESVYLTLVPHSDDVICTTSFYANNWTPMEKVNIGKETAESNKTVAIVTINSNS